MFDMNANMANVVSEEETVEKLKLKAGWQ